MKIRISNALKSLLIVLFCGLLSSFLLFQLGCFVSEKAGILAEDFNTKSQLEGRSYTQYPKVSVDGLLSGQFQSSLGDWISDHVPARDFILLTNAALQRTGISTANNLTRYDAYPTFYGSDCSVVPDEGMVVRNSVNMQGQTKAFKAWVNELNNLARNNKGLPIIYQQFCTLHTSEFNPTHKYKSNAYTQDWVRENLEDALDSSIVYHYKGIDSFNELKDGWFPTEHHATQEYMVGIYNQLSGELGWKRIDYSDSEEICEKWYGSNNRKGLDLSYSSNLVDLPTDFSNLTWTDKQGNSNEGGTRNSILFQDSEIDEDPVYNLFDAYYGSTNIQAVNSKPPNDKTCLVICTSYVRPIRNYIANNYKRTIVRDPSNVQTNMTLQNMIDDYSIDEIIIMIGDNDWQGFQAKSPKFLGL